MDKILIIHRDILMKDKQNTLFRIIYSKRNKKIYAEALQIFTHKFNHIAKLDINFHI